MRYNDRVTNFKPPVRIGISGKMRSGKDSTADYLVAALGFQKFSFAERLKELAVEMFGMRPREKNRSLLVALGAKLCSVDPMVFVNCTLRKMPLNANVVVSDLRFPYEFYALKMMGFKLVRMHVSREEQVRRIRLTEPGMDLELLDDPSETALDELVGWDDVIDGSMPFKSIYRVIADDVASWEVEHDD